MDEDTLPPSHATTIPSSPPLDPRYRDISPTSSEPPLFSSDGPLEAEDLTNYESPRVKRKRVGPWWDQELGGVLGAKKTKLSRNFDSGVFMMSDGSFGSDGSNELPSSSAPLTREETRAERIKRETEGMRKEEATMYGMVQDLVERGKTEFFFGSMKLQDSDLRHLRPITTIIQAPMGAGVDVPAEGQYRSMIPEIYLELQKNRLSKLEPTLFDLQYITTLNLSSNQIEELPPQIAKLPKLKTLNLTINKLQWLPCEILSLLQPTGNLQRLMVMSNPIDGLTCDGGMRVIYRDYTLGLEPIYTTTDIQANIERAYALLPVVQDTQSLVWLIKTWETRLEEYETPSHHRYCPSIPVTAWKDQNDLRIRFIGATPPSYFDTKGRLLDNSPVASSSEVIITTNRGAWGMPSTFFIPPSNTKVTPLVNMAMKNALLSETPADIRRMLADALYGEIPPTVEKLLQRAEANFECLSECHVCGEYYLVPAAEWIEVWSPGTRHNVRVKVQVCSWGCVPDEIGMPPQEELVWDPMERPDMLGWL